MLRHFAYFLFATLIITSLFACRATKNTTSTISYYKDVKVIMDLNCAGTCHNAGKPAGGIDLTTYEKVKEYTLNGNLIPAIQHAEGAKAMPKKAPKLDDATIQIILNWANTGANI